MSEMREEISSKNLTQLTSPLKAIRQKCLDCVWGNATEVRLCPSESCPLFPFRFGKNPFRKKPEYTQEQKAEMAERLKSGRKTIVKTIEKENVISE